MKYLYKTALTLCAVFFASVFTLSPAFSAEPIVAVPKKLAPEQLIEKAINDVMQDMRNNEALYTKEPAKLRGMVDQRVSPYFHFGRMTQLAMGKYWPQANDKQRQELATEFKQLLIRSYASTLFAYRSVAPEIEADKNASDKKTTLKLQVKNSKGDLVSLFIRMEKIREDWRIIDVNAEGISLIITARARFAEEIDKNGIQGLITALAKENLERAAP